MPDALPPELLRKVAPFRRDAWHPDVVEGDGDALASKFSGRPWLRRGEGWPACGNCGRPLQLFVQLNARDLPPEGARVLGGGMVQLFYCTREEPLCEVECEAFLPGAKSTLVRWIAPAELADGATAEPPPEMFPPRRIVAWRKSDDYPNWEELGDLGVTLDDGESEALGDRFPSPGDKLLGWPFWVQGVEYPHCPDCGRRMELLFQLDSEDNLPYMFGDSGAGHVTRCPDHPHRLAFGWACC